MKRSIDRFKNSTIKKIITLSQQLNLPRRNSRSVVPYRFLVVCTTGIGDTLWGIPAIRALRETFPEGYIGVLTNPLGFEILKGNPDINGIFIYSRGFGGCFSLPELLKQIRRKYIDVVFIFHASDRIIWPISFFTGAPEIIGIHGQNKGLDFILTRALSSQNNIHGIESRLKLVGQVGANTSHRTITIHLTNKDKEWARKFLERNGINENQLLVGLHPGAQKPFKCWPAKNFIEVGNILVESLGCETILTGDSKEKALVEDIASKIKGAIPTAGKLSLRETAAVIERMHLFITNDTGPMHIAFALGIPTIALFSSTDPKLCGPYYAEKATVIEKARTCNPCIGKKCYNPICMEQISVEEVVGFAKELLREKK